MAGATDGALVEQVAAGDPGAFAELYGRFARAVLGLALRRLGDRGRAEDSVQEVFASVWRTARSYDRGRGPGGAWLYTVACDAIAGAQQPGNAPTPDGDAEASWNAWRVYRALETLPGQERRAIDLIYFSGLSATAVADFLQLSLGTVRTQTRSGLALLAAALEGEL